MNGKKFCLLLIAIIALFLVLGTINTANAKDSEFDVTRNVDGNVIGTVSIQHAGSKAVYGIENNLGLADYDKETHEQRLSSDTIDVDDGVWTYDHLENNNVSLGPNDRVYGKDDNNLVAIYDFSPYMFAKIDIVDEHGNAGGSADFAKMKESGDSITHTFKPFTDVDPAYTPLYIQDLETNETYNPGDSYTISYDDVAKTGTTRMVKTFQYMYEKIPTFDAEITVIDPQGNADRHATFPGMKPGDNLTQTFADLVDYDAVHYDFWYIVDETGTIYLQPGDTYTITYDDCLAVNDNISKVFEYKYGYFPDYTVTYISVNPNGVFDNVTITVNRENWSAFYTLPQAPAIEGKVLDYIHIVEDDVNYKVGSTYEAMYDMCLSEGDNLTRTFEYNYKEGSYANVTVNYIVNAPGSEYDGLVFDTIFEPYCVVGEELIGGFVLDYPIITDFEFVSVTYSEEIVNGVKAMVDGSDVTDIGGFWVYEITETGDITLNFVYNYISTKVDPTPEPTPTPAPAPGNETDPVVPVDNNVVNNTNSTDTSNVTAKAVSNDSNVITMPVTGKNPWIAVAVLIVFILLFIIGYYFDKGSEE